MPSGLGSPLLCLGRIVAILALSLLTFTALAFILLFRLPGVVSLHAFYFHYIKNICGLRILVQGEMCAHDPILFLANHSSYLDYVILSDVILKGVFVAKIEIRRWPILGFLSQLTDVIYIDRTAKHQVTSQNEQIHKYLQRGHRVILFPEGTTSEGHHLLPFKTSLLANVYTKLEGGMVTIQPISITAIALDDIPLGRSFRSLYAWCGTMDLLTHLWIFLQLGRVTVEVMFHPPITGAEFQDRKELSRFCARVIQKGMSESIRGRCYAKT